MFSKINLKIRYPNPYERIVRDYKKANIESINLVITRFNRENLFIGKNVNEQVHLFNQTVLNIFKNFVPNKVANFDDSDPPWINEQIKSLVKLKNEMFKLYLQSGKKHDDYILLQNSNHQVSDMLKKIKLVTMITSQVTLMILKF